MQASLEGTRNFLRDMYTSVKNGVAEKKSLNAIYKDTYAALQPNYGDWVIFDHCLPFDVTRAYDEAGGIRDPRIWTDERDRKMWEDLEG